MSKFKAGDLAIIVGARWRTRNVGKVCELVFWVNQGDRFVNPVDGISSRNSSPDSGWFVVGDTLLGDHGDGYCLIGERYLMPLRGDFQPEQRKAKEEEPCH